MIKIKELSHMRLIRVVRPVVRSFNYSVKERVWDSAACAGVAMEARPRKMADRVAIDMRRTRMSVNAVMMEQIRKETNGRTELTNL